MKRLFTLVHKQVAAVPRNHGSQMSFNHVNVWDTQYEWLKWMPGSRCVLVRNDHCIVGSWKCVFFDTFCV